MIELQLAKCTYADDIRRKRRDEEKIRKPRRFPAIPRITKIEERMFRSCVAREE